MRHLSLAAPASVIILAVLAWAAAGWLCFANWRRATHRRTAGLLEALRFILMTLLALTLLRPEYVEKLERTATPEIAILTDASDSMKTRDISLTNGIVSRQQWMARQWPSSFLASRPPTKTRSTGLI
jgi:hypothetical protein